MPSIHLRALSPGARAVEIILLERLHRALSPEQCEELWHECRAYMEDDPETISEIESSCTGRLDTYTRDGLLESIAQVLTALSWPCNADSPAIADRFAAALRTAWSTRGYAPSAGAAA